MRGLWAVGIGITVWLARVLIAANHSEMVYAIGDYYGFQIIRATLDHPEANSSNFLEYCKLGLGEQIRESGYEVRYMRDANSILVLFVKWRTERPTILGRSEIVIAEHRFADGSRQIYDGKARYPQFLPVPPTE